MVNAGRVACIFTPFALSIATLVCLVFIFLGGTSQGNKTLGAFYFVELDLTNFTLSSVLANAGSSSATTTLADALKNAKNDLDLRDFYTIYLWNYCSWNGATEYAYCSPKKSEFWFNPIDVWGLNSTGINVDTLLPKNLHDELDAYHAASKYLFIIYTMALATTLVSLLIGISALFSRWGSFATTIFANAAFVFTAAASILATVLFLAVKSAINTAFKDYNITASIGGHIFRTTWLATAFALGAGFFWFLSICCCSGRSPYKGRGDGSGTRRVRVEKTPYTYERVGSPYLGPRDGGSSVPLQNLAGRDSRNTAYEPFRPQQVPGGA